MGGKFLPFFFILFCIGEVKGVVPADTFMKTPKADYVVLLHGIARTGASMKKLDVFLGKAGYEVLNITYPSTNYDLETLASLVHDQISARIKDETRAIHFITHSMGGLVVRRLLYRYRPPSVGRVVMLAPPSQGSEVADFLKTYLNGPYQFLYGPAGQELGTEGQKGFPVEYELGIIAGDRSLDPFGSLLIPGKDDGRVSVTHTKTEGMQDHITIHATHTFIMNNKEAMAQALFFLQHGTFRYPPQPEGKEPLPYTPSQGH